MRRRREQNRTKPQTMAHIIPGNTLTCVHELGANACVGTRTQGSRSHLARSVKTVDTPGQEFDMNTIKDRGHHNLDELGDGETRSLRERERERERETERVREKELEG